VATGKLYIPKDLVLQNSSIYLPENKSTKTNSLQLLFARSSRSVFPLLVTISKNSLFAMLEIQRVKKKFGKLIPIIFVFFPVPAKCGNTSINLFEWQDLLRVPQLWLGWHIRQPSFRNLFFVLPNINSKASLKTYNIT